MKIEYDQQYHLLPLSIKSISNVYSLQAIMETKFITYYTILISHFIL